MKNDNQEQILQRAIDTYGVEKQVEMMIEECAELIHALQKWKRDPAKIDNVHEELADVEILSYQMRRIFDESIIDNQIDYKIDRLLIRLDKSKLMKSSDSQITYNT